MKKIDRRKSPEFAKRTAEVSKQRWASYTPEQREQLIAKQVAARAANKELKRKAKLEKQRAKSARSKAVWESFTPEEQAAINAKRRHGRDRARYFKLGITRGYDRPSLEQVYNEHGLDALRDVVEYRPEVRSESDLEPIAVPAPPTMEPDPVTLEDAIATVNSAEDIKLLAVIRECVSTRVRIKVSFTQALEYCINTLEEE